MFILPNSHNIVKGEKLILKEKGNKFRMSENKKREKTKEKEKGLKKMGKRAGKEKNKDVKKKRKTMENIWENRRKERNSVENNGKYLNLRYGETINNREEYIPLYPVRR